MGKRRVVITGAAGYVGSNLTPSLTERYELVRTDIREPLNHCCADFVQMDITDLNAVRDVIQGIDTVIHLAGDPRPSAPWESLLTANIFGVYNVFQAADEARCRRVVFASSGHVTHGYPPSERVNARMPTRPTNLYGASKVWGEAIAHLYAGQRGVSRICLRRGWVRSRDQTTRHANVATLDIIVTHEDLLRLVVASVEAPDSLRFGVCYGLSDNRVKRFDISSARRILGYEPKDDSFALAGVGPSRWWSIRGMRAVKRLLRRFQPGRGEG